MWQTTLRHMGLCGTSFWYLDQTEALSGTPLGILSGMLLVPWNSSFQVPVDGSAVLVIILTPQSSRAMSSCSRFTSTSQGYGRTS